MFHALRDRRFVDAAGAVLAIYLATLFLLPKNVFWTPDEGSKWMAMHCVGFDGGLTYTVDFPSQRVDTKYKFLPHVGLIFLIPGRRETLRVNGRACITRDETLLASLEAMGKRPVLAIGVEVEEVYLHCAKAFIRSAL